MKVTLTNNGNPHLLFSFQEKNNNTLLAQTAHPTSHAQLQQPTEMKHFLKSIQILNLPEIKNQPQIDKIKKRIEAFAKQYGEKTQKTTIIFMNYLETVRQNGVNYLRNNELVKAASYFAECLRFIDPKYDEIYYQKFLIVKIDAINKLMYCIFEIESLRNLQKSIEDNRDQIKYNRYVNAQKIVTQFLEEISQFHKIESLRRSENSLLQVTYFYLGRLHRKNKANEKAISAFKQSEQLMNYKLTTNKYTKNQEQNIIFLSNLKIKTYYKLSKCYRQLKEKDNRNKYEQLALSKSQYSKSELHSYIKRKIQAYNSKQKFQMLLSKLEGKRRIEDEILRLIEESRQREMPSLYSEENYREKEDKY